MVEASEDLHRWVGIFLIAAGARAAGVGSQNVIEIKVYCACCCVLGGFFLKVLKLSAQGLPQSWISLEQAVLHYAADEVRWEVGAQVAVFRGGHNAMTGEQSIITVSKGVPNINPFDLKPGLTNGKLFARDRNVCAYCGGHFHEEDLTREHIIPFAQNGKDHWMNVVTACRACNHRKSNRTPEQAHMPLLYAPYVPSLWEDFILRNRRILADQMEFLMAHLPKTSRLHA
jgi:hypothetical protein